MTRTVITALPRKVGTFLDLIKFVHTVFAMPFALLATVMGLREIHAGWTEKATWGRLGLILLCMVAARTFAMTVNRLVDRRFDAANPRTARRPSVTGIITPVVMVLVIGVCAAAFAAGAVAFYVIFGNPWPAILAMPVLLWLGVYSFTKRFTALCHFWLGISLGLAPVSAWIAIVPGGGGAVLTLPIVLLGLAVVFWVGGFDILYALQDEEIDRAAGLQSIPALVGRGRALWLSRLSHALTIAALVGVGVTGGFHSFYWAAAGIAAALLVVEQALVRVDDISRINIAFMTVNGLVGVVVGGLAITDVVVR